MNDKSIKENYKSTIEAINSDINVIDLQAWVLENMPVSKFSQVATQAVNSIMGTIIGAWFDAGARPEQVKTFLTKLADLLWATLQEDEANPSPCSTDSADLL